MKLHYTNVLLGLALNLMLAHPLGTANTSVSYGLEIWSPLIYCNNHVQSVDSNPLKNTVKDLML